MKRSSSAPFFGINRNRLLADEVGVTKNDDEILAFVAKYPFLDNPNVSINIFVKTKKMK
jgi:hypothetical protein